jgi:phosphoribosylanthranilate isomerase
MKPALSQLWIKICGVTRNRDALLAAELGADAIGLVFYANSPRALVATQISNVVANVSGSVSVIGLFVNPTREEVEVVLDTGLVDVLQFHGAEDEEFCNSFDIPYLKAFQVKDIQSLDSALSKYRTATYILLDSYSGKKMGGTGQKFDWSIGEKIVRNLGQKVVVAGGLKPENIKDAVIKMNPFGVDVSSGIESSPGLKDAEKLRKFIEGARSV